MQDFNQLTDIDLENSLGDLKASNSLNGYMTKIELCFFEDDELLSVKTARNTSTEILFRKRLLKINAELLTSSNEIEFSIMNLNPDLEAYLNIGIFRIDNYIGFHMNLTAYKQFIDYNDVPLPYIEISVGRMSNKNLAESGMHLLVFPYQKTCSKDYMFDSSDPAIINFYRQLLIRFDVSGNFDASGYNKLLTNNSKFSNGFF